MVFLDFSSHFEAFGASFTRILGEGIEITVTGIITPYREKFIGLQPEGGIRAKQVKVRVKPEDSLNPNDLIIWKGDKYVIIEPMDYSEFSNVITYLATLVEPGVT